MQRSVACDPLGSPTGFHARGIPWGPGHPLWDGCPGVRGVLGDPLGSPLGHPLGAPEGDPQDFLGCPRHEATGTKYFLGMARWPLVLRAVPGGCGGYCLVLSCIFLSCIVLSCIVLCCFFRYERESPGIHRRGENCDLLPPQELPPEQRTRRQRDGLQAARRLPEL